MALLSSHARPPPGCSTSGNAPTPGKARRIRETTVAKLLKRNRIRRFKESGGVAQAASAVAAGTTEAAALTSPALLNASALWIGNSRTAHRKLDVLTASLASSAEAGPEQHDAEILASLPGVGRIVLATLLAEAWDALHRRDYAALRSLAGVAPVTKRSGKSCIVVEAGLPDSSPTPCIIGRVSLCSMTPEAAPNMPH